RGAPHRPLHAALRRGAGPDQRRDLVALRAKIPLDRTGVRLGVGEPREAEAPVIIDADHEGVAAPEVLAGRCVRAENQQKRGEGQPTRHCPRTFKPLELWSTRPLADSASFGMTISLGALHTSD